MSAFESLAIEIDAHVATVTMRAAGAGKAPRMGPAFWREMPAAFAELDADPGVRAVVLRGEGAQFTSGLDLATMGGELAPVLGGDALARERTAFYETIQRMQRAMTCVAACRKPVIAAVAGACIGGGVDLITACDVRVCAADARFSVREVRLAMVADVGTLARLPAIVGQGHARELALTGDDIDAARALRIGLVNDVYPTHDALHAAARALAVRVAANPPLVVAGVKQVMNADSERAAAESLRNRGAVERGVPRIARSPRSDDRVPREAGAEVRWPLSLPESLAKWLEVSRKMAASDLAIQVATGSLGAWFAVSCPSFARPPSPTYRASSS